MSFYFNVLLVVVYGVRSDILLVCSTGKKTTICVIPVSFAWEIKWSTPK